MLEAVALPLVKWALSEDVGSGDITTLNTLPAGIGARAVIVMKEPCVVAGLEVARLTFREVDSHLTFEPLAADGDRVDAGVAVARVFGSAGGILTGERTALNFLQRLTSVATQTRRFVDAVAGTHAIILDTRKTTPTLRVLEKYAVRAGGASNHRVGLFDAILIKDNHIRLAGGVANAMTRVRAHRPGLPVEIEAETLAQVDEALAAGADRILVDNMTIDGIRDAVARSRGRATIEISGGVTLERISELAATGADFVSVGALTHSAPAIDISFEIEPA